MGRIEVTGRRGRKSKKLLDGLVGERGYWILKEEAVENSLWERLWTCLKADYRMNDKHTIFLPTCFGGRPSLVSNT